MFLPTDVLESRLLLKSFMDCSRIISMNPAMEILSSYSYRAVQEKMCAITVVVQEMIDREFDILNLMWRSIDNNQLLSSSATIQQHVHRLIEWRKKQSLNTYCRTRDLPDEMLQVTKVKWYTKCLVAVIYSVIFAQHGWEFYDSRYFYGVSWVAIFLISSNLLQRSFLHLEAKNIYHRYHRHCNSRLFGLFDNMMKSIDYMVSLRSYLPEEIVGQSHKFLSDILIDMSKVHTRNSNMPYTAVKLRNFIKLCENCKDELTENNIGISTKELDLFFKTSQEQNTQYTNIFVKDTYGCNANKVLPVSASTIAYMGIATVGLMVLSAFCFIYQSIFGDDSWDVHLCILVLVISCLLISVKKRYDIGSRLEFVSILERISLEEDRNMFLKTSGYLDKHSNHVPQVRKGLHWLDLLYAQDIELCLLDSK